MSENGPRKLEHGFTLADWRVLPQLNQLCRGTRTLTIEPQMMAVLSALAANPGAVVSADDLIATVWAGRPISDNPVYKTITKLRRALGDNSRQPIYIATVSKRGYHLVAPVSFPEDMAPAVAAIATLPDRKQRRRWLPIVGVIALLGFGLVWYATRTEPPFTGDSQIRQLVTLPGSSYDASPAADESRLVFVNANAGAPQIWLLEHSSGHFHQLTHDPAGAHSPAWSPLSDNVLFVRNNAIWSTDLNGNAHKLIENAGYPSWSGDGQTIVFERGQAVWTANALGEAQHSVTEIAAGEQLMAPRQPALSMDGQQIVYFEPTEGPLGDFWLLDIPSGKSRQLTFDNTLAGAARITTDGHWIIFNSSRGGSMSLWRIATEGGIPKRLLASTSDDSAPRANARANKVIYTSTRAEWSLRITAPGGGNATTLFASRHPILAPELSPDNTHLAFFAVDAQGNAHTYVQALGATQPLKLTKIGQTNAMPKWSSDGAWVYYYHFGEDSSWRRTRADGTGLPEVVVPNWSFNREHDATIHPNGNWVIYANLVGESVVSTQLRNLTTGAVTQFAIPISWPDWSADGSRLLATQFGTNPIPVGPIVHCRIAGSVHACDTIAERGQHPVWSFDEEFAYFVEPDATLLKVWRHDFSRGDNTLVTELGPVSELGPFIAVTPNEEIIWVEYQAGRSELWQASW